MSKLFVYQLKQTPERALEMAKESAAKNGALLEGDVKEGTFSGFGILGSYKIIGNTIEVAVADKPFVVPWSLVESKINSFFQ